MAFNPKAKRVAVDTETTGLNPWHDAMAFTVGMCDDDGELWSCQWPVDPHTRMVCPDTPTWNYVQDVLGNPDVVKIFHNAGFDFKMLEKMDFTINGRMEDTLFMARIFNNVSQENGLKPLAKRMCGIASEDVDRLHEATIAGRKHAKALGWNIAEAVECDYWIPKALNPADRHCEHYCEQDVFRTMGIWYVFDRLYERDTKQHFRTTYERELELFKIVMRMEKRGVPISREKCIVERKESILRMQEAYYAMRELAGYDFSPNSSKQVAEILFGKFKLPILEYTATGDPSCRLTAIRPHAAHPFVNHLLTYRSAHKSVGTFFDNYLEKMVPDPKYRGCWQMHPNINQLVTKTARFSMHDPNLQQVANADTSALGGRMVMARRPFGPRPGYVWLSADYAQQELRIFAALADIKMLVEVIRQGKDPNTENANFAWGGRNNPAAVYAAKLSMELKDPVPSTEHVAALWEEFKWDPDKQRALGGLNSAYANEIARIWLDRFDWRIVEAEASIKKKNTRSRCKVVTFDLMYGGGAQSLVNLLFVSLEEAKGFLRTMHDRYPEIRRFANRLTGNLNQWGYIVNPYGRRLQTEDGRDYTCVNYMIQSSAADMMKEAMMQCQRVIDKAGLDVHMVLTVHDELVFEARKEHTYRWLLNELREAMEDTHGRFSVPMKAEINFCPVQWDRKIPFNPEGNPEAIVWEEIKYINAEAE